MKGLCPEGCPTIIGRNADVLNALVKPASPRGLSKLVAKRTVAAGAGCKACRAREGFT